MDQYGPPAPQFTACPSPAYDNDSTYQGRALVDRIPSANSSAFSSVKRAKKRVTFKPTCTVRTHKDAGPTKEEKAKLYYSRDELKIMNLEVHAICTLSQELPKLHNSGTLLTMTERRDGSMLGPDDGDADAVATSLRGLELIMYPKRRQNKQLAKRTLLKYQTFLKAKKSLSTNERSMALAAASAKLNRWSSLVATETARLDALRAFEGDYLIPTTAEPEVDILPPFPFHKKRMLRRGSRQVTPPPPDGNDDVDRQFKRRKVD